jgi:hypothetical protein
MAALLTAFLSDAGRRGFAWGDNDCMLFVANWAKQLTGDDPGAPWRGTYSTEDEAEKILARGGGPGPILHGALVPQGWAPVPTCQPGDIAVVRAPTRAGRSLVAAILAGRGKFAMLTPTGLVYGPVPLLLGWRHPNGSCCHG